MGLMVDPASGANLTLTPNPITCDGQQHLVVALGPRETLGALLRRTVPDWADDAWEVRVNGVLVQHEVLDRVRPKPGVLIEARGVMKRQVAAIVAHMALAYFTLGGGTIAGWALGTASFFGTALVRGAVYLAGSALINKVLAPKLPSLQTTQSDPVYSISSARNQTRPYDPLPITLGRVRVTPDIISAPYTWYEGNDQYLGVVLTPGVNVHSIEELYNGDTLLSSYEGVQVYLNGFPGHPDQDIPLFSNADTIAGGELLSDGTWVQRTTPQDTVRVQINLEYVLGDVTSKGKPKNNRETVQAEYRPAGSGGWQLLATRTFVNNDYDQKRATLSADLPRGQYDIRVRRLGLATEHSNGKAQFQWTALTAVQADDTDYTGIPRIGIRIKATGQLNGALDEIRCVAKSLPVPVWDGSAWTTQQSSNPGAHLLAYARGVYDANGRLLMGIGLQDEMIDIPALQAFMLHCARNGYTYDAHIKDARNHQEMVDAIALAGFGQTSWAGGRFSVVWADSAQPLTAVVNMATIKRGSFQVDYTLDKAADGIEYTYVDPVTWEPRTLRVAAPGVQIMHNPARVTGEGVTSEAHAAKLARYHLAQSLYQYKAISFSTDLEHLTYRRMSLLALSHDMTQWGFSGRLRGAAMVGGVVSLALDEPVPSLPTRYIGLRIPGEGVYRVFEVAPFEGESDTLTLIGAWPQDARFPGDAEDNPAHDTIWTYDFKATPGYRVRVVQIEPEMDLEGARVAVVPEGPEFWNYVLNGTYEPPPNQSLLPTSPVASNLRITELQVVQGDTVYTELQALWDVSGQAAFTTVHLAQWLDSQWGELRQVAEVRSNEARFRIPSAGTYRVVVRPHNTAGVVGGTVSVDYTTVGADIPPPPFDTVGVQALGGGVRKYFWGYNSTTLQAPDYAGAEVRYIAGTHADPDWDAMQPVVGDGFHTAPFEAVVPDAGTYTFAFRARNTSGLLSPQTVVTTTLQASLGETLDEQVQALVAAQAALDQEIADRLAGDLAESQARANAIAAQQEALADEVQARVNAIAAEQAARIAGDAAEATARTQAIQDEANARATALLNEKNEREAAISAEATIRQTADESLAVEIASVAAGTGEQFDPKRIWYFDSDLESWSSNGGTATIVDGWLRPVNHSSAAYVTSPDSLGIDGSAYRFVKLRIKKVGNPTWLGRLQWTTTTDNTFNSAKQMDVPEPEFDSNGVATLSFKDVAWWPNTIRRIRLQLFTAQTSTNYVLIDWVAIGRPTPGAGVALVQDEAAARIAGDAAEATQRTTLATQLRGDYTGTDVNSVTSGLIYSERQARVSGDQANASAISSLQARMPSGSGKLATEASVTEEASARAAADNALSTRVSTVEARMPTGTGQLATAAAVQAVEGRVSSVEGTVNSQSSAITSLTNRVGQVELAGTNQLPNPGFEIDSFWTLQPGWEYAAGEGRNGSRCVKRPARAGATVVHHDPYRVPVSPGQVWRIRSWYKTTADFNGTSSSSKLRLGDQADSLIYPATAPFTVSTEWKMTERTYTVPADGSVTHLRVSINGNNSAGTLWVDDVSLENITELSELQNADAANANAISDLTTRVTSAEGAITSQGSAITSLTNEVTTARGGQSNLNNRLNGIDSAVNSKASSSAVSALEGRVTATENSISSHSSSITNLTNELQAVAASGENLIINGSFGQSDNGWTGTIPIAATEGRNGGACAKIPGSSSSRSHSANYGRAIQIRPGRRYRVSCWYKTDSAFNGSTANSKLRIADQASNLLSGQAFLPNKTSWTEVSYEFVPNSSTSGLMVQLQANHTAGTLWVDDVVVEDITDYTTFSGAISNLQSTVTQQGNTITSQGSAITSLQNRMPAGNGTLATAAALSSLDSRVTSAEGQISAQASSITTVQASLDGKADVSVTNALSADTATLKARYTLTTDVNGKISGYRSENNGDVSSFEILSDVFRVVSGGAEGMEWQDGYLRVYRSGTGNYMPQPTFGSGLGSWGITWDSASVGATLVRNRYDFTHPSASIGNVSTGWMAGAPVSGTQYIAFGPRQRATLPSGTTRVCIATDIDKTFTGVSVFVGVDCYDANSNLISAPNVQLLGTNETTGGNWPRRHVFISLPPGTATVEPWFRLGTSVSSPNDRFVWITRPSITPATADQTQPPPWAPGPVNTQAIIGNGFGPDGLALFCGPNVGPQNASKANASLWADSNGNVGMTGLLTSSLLNGSAFTLDSTRIFTGGGRLAPFTIRDARYYVSSGTNASRTLTIDGFVSPDHGTGYNWKRFARHKMDVWIDVQISGDTGNETAIVEVEYNGNGNWIQIQAVTFNCNYRGSFPMMFRYTTLESWDTLAFRVRTTQNRTEAIRMTIDVANYNESGNAPGSNSGTGGGGGRPPPPPGGGWCVDYETTRLPDGRYVRDLRVGDLVPCWNDDPDAPAVIHEPVRAIAVGSEECFELRTASGAVVIQSRSTPMTLRDGTTAYTPDMLGRDVLVLSDAGALAWEPVTGLRSVGERRVVKMNAGDRMYFAGTDPARTLATHNMAKPIEIP